MKLMKKILSLFFLCLFLGREASAQSQLSTQSTPELQEKADEEEKKKIEQKQRKKTDQESAPPGRRGGFWGGVSVGGGSDEAALIFFAVVGITSIIAWLPYFPLLAYKALKGDEDQRSLHQLSLISGAQFDRTEIYQNGLRYSFYLKDESTDGLGLTFESGHYRIHNGIREQGSYWLLGPSLRFIIDETFFARVDLMAGRSFDGELGLISRAEASINGYIANRWSLGLGLGGSYLKMKEHEGIVSQQNKLGLLLSLNLSYSFF